MEQEKAALDLVRRALALDETELRDLRAQHGLGADAVDELARFYELMTYGGAEPDTIQLTAAEFQRAIESDNFFFVVVSGLEAGAAPVTVRIILEPLKHLPFVRAATYSSRASGARKALSTRSRARSIPRP
ncbi:hypothetical protein [Streptomyces sp. CL12-4]|uniref:hypothetical protein n=1 Tax=Streptomyces sp. CL12-4 TaxID=2810306 RepID=UPI001EFB86E3|nr:hypothetical protein [Streptomyces sp. CL12-4]MCG8971449.1 hypothetical protein [Streptomyces sp. CL12-4]